MKNGKVAWMEGIILDLIEQDSSTGSQLSEFGPECCGWTPGRLQENNIIKEHEGSADGSLLTLLFI